MSEELHKDSFEDFLKKSLQNYEETPPDKSWEHIATQRRKDLGHLTAPKMNWRPWLIAASIAFFFMALVGQHVYFSNKIDSLESVVKDQKNEELLEVETKEQITNTELHKTKDIAGIQDDSEVEQSINEKTISNQNQILEKPTIENKNTETVEIKETINQIPSADFTEKENQIVFENESVEESKAKKIPFNTESQIEKENVVFFEKTKKTEERNSHELLSQLDVNQPSLVFKKVAPSIKPSIPVFPIGGKTNAKVDIAAYGGVVKILASRPNQSSPGGPPSTQDSNQPNILAYQSGLTTSIHLTKNLRLRTGLGIENQSISHNFYRKLRYRDGHHHGPGGTNLKHDFQFDINSGNSSLEVDIRAEDLSQNTAWSPDDEITFKVNTQHKQQSLFVPLQLGYEMQKGRWSVALYGGPSFQVIRKDDLRVNGFEVQGNRLRVDSNSSKFKKKDNPESSVFMHGLASLNIGYKLTPRIRIGLEPTYSKSFLKGPDMRRFGLLTSISYSL